MTVPAHLARLLPRLARSDRRPAVSLGPSGSTVCVEGWVRQCVCVGGWAVCVWGGGQYVYAYCRNEE